MRPRCGLTIPRLLTALAISAGFVGGPGRVQAQAGGGDDGNDPADPSGEPKKELTERQKKTAELFKASKVSFDKDRIVLEYNFESMDQTLTDDWLPALNAKNMRIRWARRGEGTLITIEDGLILGDSGEFMHSAVFASNVEVELDLMPVSPFKSGNLMGPVFFNEKKKQGIGTNEGGQVVCISNRKVAKPPIPKTERKVPANERHKIGFTYDGTKVDCRFNGRKLADSSTSPKFTEGFDTGHIGIVWSGSIQYFLFKVTIKGKLDSKWLATKIGEDLAAKPEPSGTKDGAKAGTPEVKTKKAKDAKGKDGSGTADPADKADESKKAKKAK